MDPNLLELIDEIKQLIPLEEYVGRFLKRGRSSGDNIFFNSPWSNDSTPSFNVSKSKQIWKDFTGVGGPRLSKDGKSVSSGDLIGFVMQINDISFNEAIALLVDELQLDLSKYPNIKLNKNKNILPKYTDQQMKILEINKQSQLFFAYNFDAIRDVDNQISKAEHYATAVRGYTKETIKEFGLGYAHNDYKALYSFLNKKGYSDDDIRSTGLVSFKDNGVFDVFNNRLMVPVTDSDGNCLGWGGRGLDGSDYKYLNTSSTPVFEKNKILFRLDHARSDIRREGCVLLMEGFLDVVTAWQNGFKNVVASMGTSFSKNQLETLSKISNTIVIAFDGDKAGIKATLRVFDDFYALNKDLLVKAILIPNELDPDDFLKKHGSDAFNDLIKESMPYLDFKLTINSHILSKSMNEISAFKKDIFNDFFRFNLEPTEIRLYLNKLSSILKVDLSVLVDDYSSFSNQIIESPHSSSVDAFSISDFLEKPPLPEHSLKAFNFNQIKSIDDVKKVVFKHLNSIFVNDDVAAFQRILEWKIKNPSMDMLECSWVDYFLQNDIMPTRLLDYRIVANLMDNLNVAIDDSVYDTIGTLNDKSKGVPVYFVNRTDPSFLRRSAHLWVDVLRQDGNLIDLDDLNHLLETLLKQTIDNRHSSFLELPFLTRLAYNSIPIFKARDLMDSIRVFCNKKEISISGKSLIIDDVGVFSSVLGKRLNLYNAPKIDLFYENMLNNMLSTMVNKNHKTIFDTDVLQSGFSYFKKNFSDVNKNLIVSSKKMDLTIIEFLFTHLNRLHTSFFPKKDQVNQFQRQEEIAR